MTKQSLGSTIPGKRRLYHWCDGVERINYVPESVFLAGDSFFCKECDSEIRAP